MPERRLEKPKRRRRFATSLRSMVVGVLVIGLILGWRVNKARQQKLAVQAIRDYGGFVHYDWELVKGVPTSGRKPLAPAWLRRLFGDEYFQEVAWVSLVYDDPGGKRVEAVRRDDSALLHLRDLSSLKILLLREGQATDSGLVNLRGLDSLEEVIIWDGLKVTDAGVAQIAKLKGLKKLHIDNSRMTDAGLKTLAEMPTLKEISLQGNRFTNAGLAHFRDHTGLKRLYVGLGPTEINDDGLENLRGVTSLEMLDIQNTKITDKGLDVLASLPNLKEVWISGTAVTPAALVKFRQNHPTLKVVH